MTVSRRRFVMHVISTAVAMPRATHAQHAGKPYRVGFVVFGAASEVEHLTRALSDGLRDAGYVEGRNLILERRFADGDQERLVPIATELVRLNVDVIVTGSNPVIAAVKQVTSKIPVVMAVSRDPVGSGFITSLSRPGGNITGLTSDPAAELLAKNLEFLKAVVPSASRVALMWNPNPPGALVYRKAVEGAARTLGVAVHRVDVRAHNELDRGFSEIVRARVEGMVVLPDPVFFTARADMAALAARHLLPAIYGHREHAEAGGLMSYGANIAHQFRRAAAYVDKILKGTRPDELAVEQARTFELVINVRAAKALGISIPRSLLLRADQIIEP